MKSDTWVNGAAARRLRTGGTLALIVTLAAATSVQAAASDPPPTDSSDSSAPSAGSDAPAGSNALADDPRFEPQPLPEPVSLTVTMAAPIASFANGLLAEELGEFDRENLDVEIEMIPGADALPMTANGEVDVTFTSFVPALLNGVDQGFELKMIAPLYADSGEAIDGLYVRNDLVDGAPGNMAGQMYSAVASGSPFLPVGDWLAGSGVSLGDLQFTYGPPDSFVPGLQNGDFGLAFINSPVPAGVDEHATRVATFAPGLNLAGVVIGPSLLDGDPAVVEAFVRALARTQMTYLQGRYYENPEVVDAMVATTGVPAETYQPGTELVWSPTLWMSPELPEALIRYQGYLMEIPDTLAYDEPIPAEQLLDLSYLDSTGFGGDS